MKLTQAQVRTLADIGEETFRVWRRAFPALREKTGNGPIFTLGEALATCAIKAAVSTLGAKVSCLAPSSQALFAACEDATRRRNGPDKFVCVSASGASVLGGSGLGTELKEVALVVPLHTLLDSLQAKLLSEGFDQERLPFEDV